MSPSTESCSRDADKAKPFLKWAGGKSQLLGEIRKRLPAGIEDGTITRYVEPFIGGGAVFFDVSQSHSFDNCLLLDANEDLILVYRTIQSSVDKLVGILSNIAYEYHELSPEKQSEYFYKTRLAFNEAKPGIDYSTFGPAWLDRAAQILFLNRTCFNGLFRVNSRGEFNVPIGSYKDPAICHPENLRRVARALQNAEIRVGDFEACAPSVDSRTFVYFDPPYRPLNKTAKFTSYASTAFDEASQLRLAQFFRQLDKCGAKLMLSNSDPKNEDPDDDFFENAYADFTIERVKATRMINSDAAARGQINEVIVTNY